MQLSNEILRLFQQGRRGFLPQAETGCLLSGRAALPAGGSSSAPSVVDRKETLRCLHLWMPVRGGVYGNGCMGQAMY